ncbi:Rpn family recombination-promoting nuclease/putative transposase [Halomonas sp.]|uniref:Rpn family recombination-promoting nuclease/putative transposase n=1 Tax=Halomonas sp. TaxID=1486246 RepID=UPI00384A6F11
MVEEASGSSDFDSPWKEALEHYFPQFLQLLMPEMYRDIDWQRPHEFLDKELQQVVRDTEAGRRHADKLVKVYTLNGSETWVLIHVEVQGKADRHFNARMYRYYYRLQDKYPQRRIASVAILTDKGGHRMVGRHEQGLWQTRLCFDFPVVDLQQVENDRPALENSTNPFAVVVLSQLEAHRTKGDDGARLVTKFSLMKRLYQHGFTRTEVLELLRLIDWMLVLPPALEEQLEAQMARFEEEVQMTYVTSFERIAEKRGMQQGMQQGALNGRADMLLKLLALKFGGLPEELVTKVETADIEALDRWAERVLTTDTLDAIFD